MPVKKPLEWTRRAARDVISIEAYLGQFNPAAAESLVDAVLNSAVSIASHPEIGRSGKLPRTRELVVSKFPYVIVYRVQAKRVVIARVLHQARQHP